MIGWPTIPAVFVNITCNIVTIWFSKKIVSRNELLNVIKFTICDRLFSLKIIFLYINMIDAT